MNSTILALLLLSGLDALPERPLQTPPAVARAWYASQPTDQATRLAAKGRLPKERLQLRMADRLTVAAN